MREGGASLLSSSCDRVRVSAVKRHAARNTLVVRLCNLSDERVDETLTLGRRVRAAWRTNLLEEREGDLPVCSGYQVALTLGAHGIATAEIEFEEE